MVSEKLRTESAKDTIKMNVKKGAGISALIAVGFSSVACGSDSTTLGAYNALERKNNVCSNDSQIPLYEARDLGEDIPWMQIDPAACTDMLQNTTMSLVYDPNTFHDVGYFEQALEQSYQTMTSGNGVIDVIPIALEGDIAEQVADADCAPRQVKDSFTVRAAQQQPAINQNDFIMGVYQQKNCETEYDRSTDTAGMAYSNAGARVMDMFGVQAPDEVQNAKLENGSYSERDITVSYMLHEMGHQILGLDHSMSTPGYVVLATSGGLPRDATGRVYYNTALIEAAPDQYGDDDTLMGSKIGEFDANSQPRDMLNPYELHDIDKQFGAEGHSAREINLLFEPNGARIAVGDDKTYVRTSAGANFTLDYDYSAGYDETVETRYTSLGINVILDESGGPEVRVYAMDGGDKYGRVGDMLLARMDIKDGEAWQLAVRNAAVPFTVSRQDDEIVVTSND